MSVAEAVEFQQPLDPAGEQYKAMLKRASNALKKQGEVQKYDPEMLVRRGNYYTSSSRRRSPPSYWSGTKTTANRSAGPSPQYGRDMQAGDWNPDAS
jgi:hypothetical protein